MAMGELWELVIEFNVGMLRPTPIVSSYKELHIDLRTSDGSDLLRGKEYGEIFSPNEHEIGSLSDRTVSLYLRNSVPLRCPTQPPLCPSQPELSWVNHAKRFT